VRVRGDGYQEGQGFHLAVSVLDSHYALSLRALNPDRILARFTSCSSSLYRRRRTKTDLSAGLAINRNFSSEEKLRFVIF